MNSLASVTQKLRVSISTDAACIRAQFTKDHLPRAGLRGKLVADLQGEMLRVIELLQSTTFTRRVQPAGLNHAARRNSLYVSLHVTLSHKPPQHRGLPRPDGAPSRKTPDAVFAAASPRGRRKDDASRNNRARSASRARPAPTRPSLNLAPKASSIAHRTASSALSKISRALLRSSKKAARLQTRASLEDVVANRFAAELHFHGPP